MFSKFFFRLILGMFFFVLGFQVVFAKVVVPNELGRIPFMEYHSLAEKEAAFVRSIENFRKDLEFFYNSDYALITVEDYINQHFDVPAGRKPLIFTFDDSSRTQFTYLSDGTIDPESVIGIMDAFFAQHPDFGRSAIFYVNSGLFGQPLLAKKKLVYLLETNREIGNHTISHSNLGQRTYSEIVEDLAGIQRFVQEILGAPLALKSLAYPFGGVPDLERMPAVRSGSFSGVSYEITSGMLVGADPEYPPYYLNFDPMTIRRIQADDSEFRRWFQREPGFTSPADEIFYPFVSDGSANVVSVFEKDISKIDSKLLKEGLYVVKSAEMEVAERGPVVQGWDKIVSQNANVGEDDVLDSAGLSVVQDAAFEKNGEVDLNGGVDEGEVGVSQEASAEFSVESPILKPFYAHVHSVLRPVFIFTDYVKRLVSGIEIRKLPDGLEQKEDGYSYTVQSGDTLSIIAEKFLPITKYYLRSELSTAISDVMTSKYINVGDSLQIPGVERLVVDYPPFSPSKKGIYWTGYTAGSAWALEQIENLVAAKGNMVIFDLKETAGEIFYDTQVPLAKDIGAVSSRISDVPKLVRILHKNGIYAVARLTVFKDEYLSRNKPEYALKSRSTGNLLESGEGVFWVDPSHPEVQQYNLDIAEEVAKLGVDEIQFDYIRFPTLGNADAQYFFEKDSPEMEKYQVIDAFLKKARARLDPYGVKLGIDVYGVVAWNGGYDAKSTGQKMEVISKHVDTVYPMVYPSHFGPGFNGHKNPADEPYFFVQESVKKFDELLDDNVEIVPWLQGFPWRVSNYGTHYVQQQIQALKDIGIPSFAIWSASNKYSLSLPAF